MAPDVPPEGLMGDPTRMRDDSSIEGSDPARRVARISKGKGIKQSTGVRLVEEPISHKHFEDLAHAILRAVGSRAPESSLPPVTLDAPTPQTGDQAMVRKEVPEASKPKHRSSGTRSKFQTVGSHDERSTASCNSRSSQDTRRAKRTHEDLREKLNAKTASQMAATSSGTPRVPLQLVEKIENLEAQVKLLSEKQNITATPTPMTYQSSFSMEIRTVALPEAFAMPQIPQYFGTTDPSEHAKLYRDQMLIKGVDESVMCRMFTHTLTRRSLCLRYPNTRVPLIPRSMLSYTATKCLSRV